MIVSALKPREASDGIGVDLTPIIDMVFLLLIFFLAATTFHESERELAIALPETQSAAPISAALRELVINVDAEGRAVVGGRAMDDDELRRHVEDSMRQNPDRKVCVRGDRTTAYANVARVLDICKGAGAVQPFLETVPGR